MFYSMLRVTECKYSAESPVHWRCSTHACSFPASQPPHSNHTDSSLLSALRMLYCHALSLWLLSSFLLESMAEHCPALPSPVHLKNVGHIAMDCLYLKVLDNLQTNFDLEGKPSCPWDPYRCLVMPPQDSKDFYFESPLRGRIITHNNGRSGQNNLPGVRQPNPLAQKLSLIGN